MDPTDMKSGWFNDGSTDHAANTTMTMAGSQRLRYILIKETTSVVKLTRAVHWFSIAHMFSSLVQLRYTWNFFSI
jgi:hypothetical protein